MRSSSYRTRQGRTVLMIGGLVAALVVGVGLIYLGSVLERGLRLSRAPRSTAVAPTVASPLSPLASPTSLAPTAHTLLPTATPLLPTPTSEPATLVPAMVSVGDSAVNVRSGPSTTFSRLGELEAGATAEVIGRYADWWQIEFQGAPAWVHDGVVTAVNVEGVPEVQPPASPVPPTPAPQPTATPQPTQSTGVHGLVPEGFQVEGAPGPYGAGQPIWFNFWITNMSGETVKYRSLGVRAETTDGEFHSYQESWSYSDFAPGKKLVHRDRIVIGDPGTYNLWLTIGFSDDEWHLLLGPVQVTVQ